MAQNWQKDAKNMEEVQLGSPSLEWTTGLQHRLEMMQKYIDFKDRRVMDVGCGVGMFLEKFRALGSDVYGVDVDEKKTRNSKLITQNVEVAPAEDLPFRKDSFDMVFFHEVIEHVDDDRKSINEAFRVLKPSGKLVLFAPNRLWPFETHGIYKKGKYKFGNIPLVTYLPDSKYKKLIPHVRNYRKKELYDLLKGNSYKKIVYRGVFPGFDKLSSRIPVFGKLIAKVFRILEKTPLHKFGISHFLVVEKL
ncbi:MAG: methyltransferase domain-containing protein [Patescibacteria group bacterium]|nr:class I SAM-dependent methyltransferase [Patescibacteria group bacterium]